ncbi:MAG: hypothetical protein WC246_00935 [Candidatus Paceibacterota bacterium]|jgi:hypothetical protein
MAKAKEEALIHGSEPCDTNLYGDGPATVSESKRLGRQLCPYFQKCENGFLADGRQCAMLHGVKVAQYALEESHSVATEMKAFRREALANLRRYARQGIVWSRDRKTFEIITDIEKGIQKIEDFARMILKGIEPN